MNARLILVSLLTALALAGGSVAGAAENRNFVAPLNGGEETPPVETTAAGVATFQLNADGDELSFRLIVANIDDVLFAHIHCGAAGVAGPVVLFLYGGPTVSTNGVLSEGVATDANVIDRPDSAACPGGVSDFDDLLEKMRSGDAYVNVHTTAHPGGEIRGQIH